MEKEEIDKLILRWGDLQEEAREASKNGTYTDQKYYYELVSILNELSQVYPPIYSFSQYYRDLKQTITRCPECGESKHYRIIYTDNEKTDVKFYDCMMCHTHWDKDGKNLGKF